MLFRRLLGVRTLKLDLAMTRAFDIEFGTPEHGSLRVALRSAGATYEEWFSYIYPALRTLCDALCDVAGGTQAPPVRFLLEPAELELRFAQGAGDTLTLDVVRYGSHLRPPLDLGPHEAVFHCVGDRREMLLAFWRALRRLETCLPAEAFARCWREPFPSQEMAAFTAIVTRWKTQPPAR